ncbi:MAG: hypothetical protein GWN84_08480 [Gammaproteobacteria bacterium]|nr:hypothetical protein [Gammaproteobacteria bacterium]NIR82904.1 hypothetical protein [Gammaproteobacteria bacterium]NIR90172.1 hypothetical protein [Gammaproteobacteria bacterium]NIU03731.1 hypothetical protein [Gammaproteobacteria bacterium]NIV51374.1 hypothetical protein [Gammaproteobacteria bacterium]
MTDDHTSKLLQDLVRSQRTVVIQLREEMFTCVPDPNTKQATPSMKLDPGAINAVGEALKDELGRDPTGSEVEQRVKELLAAGQQVHVPNRTLLLIGRILRTENTSTLIEYETPQGSMRAILASGAIQYITWTEEKLIQRASVAGPTPGI